MTKAKKIVKHILLSLGVVGIISSLLIGLGLLFDKNNPTYESVPYTVEEPKVYVTKYGDCYHSYDCSYLHSSMIAKGKDKAREQGYRACSKCNGVANGLIEVTYYKQVKKDMTNDIISSSIIWGVIIGGITYTFIYKKVTHNKNVRVG